MKTLREKFMSSQYIKDTRIWINRRQFWRTLKWLFAMMVGGLFPVWGSSILLNLFSQDIRWLDFIKNGEFALYSTATLAPALYLITKDDLKMPLLDKNIFGTIIFILGGLSVLIFAGVLFTKNNEATQNSILNIRFLAISSLSVYGLSIFIIFVLTLADNILTDQKMNPQKMLNEDANILSFEFDKLQEETTNGLEKECDSLGDGNEQ